MASQTRTETIWTCDRCAVVHAVEGTAPPEGWARFRKGPLNTSTTEVLGDLCRACSSLVIATILGAESVEDEPEREPVPAN